MNLLFEDKQLIEMYCGANYTCLLDDNSLFLPTEYKVLQSQNNSCFVKCMKMLYDGHIQFYYLTSSYQPFSSMIHSLSPDSFLTIASSLLTNIIDVKNNGFLSCLNINTDFDHIYVDSSNFLAKLIYVPISMNLFRDNGQFENELRTNLVKVISKTSTLSSSKTMQFMQDLSNGMLSLEDLQKRVKGVSYNNTSQNHTDMYHTAPSNVKCRISTINAPESVVFNVNKDEFVIGKKQGYVDGLIVFNKMISRIHCKVIHNNGEYKIVDLHSANGTFVNRVRIQPDVPYPLKNDDILRLANVEFRVQIG